MFAQQKRDRRGKHVHIVRIEAVSHTHTHTSVPIKVNKYASTDGDNTMAKATMNFIIGTGSRYSSN